MSASKQFILFGSSFIVASVLNRTVQLGAGIVSFSLKIMIQHMNKYCNYRGRFNAREYRNKVCIYLIAVIPCQNNTIGPCSPIFQFFPDRHW